MNFEEVRKQYEKQGVGLGTTGFGATPAIVVVDFQHVFTRGSRGCGTDAPEATAKLIEVARRKGVKVIHTYVAYDPEADKPWGVFGEKCRALPTMLEGSGDVAIDPLVAPIEGELVLRKGRASAFYGTDLEAECRRAGIDTLIVCGTSTSGCVRATVVDAVTRDFRTIVPTQCVADRSEPSAQAALFDMNSKYADVMDLSEVVATLEAGTWAAA